MAQRYFEESDFMSELYMGLISGTSADGIDAALVDLSGLKPKLVATYFMPYEENLRKQIFALYQPGADEINRLGQLDVLIGKSFAKAANHLLEKNNLTRDKIIAIGSHGQTIRHHPKQEFPFTLQIGDPNVISAETGITTIADFRRRDIALGGQGAPLVPGFHYHIFAEKNNDRIIVNIGGIANITLLPKDIMQPIVGYDTGPGNALLDNWAEKHLQKPRDENGQWAATGKVDQVLLNHLLNDVYFKSPHPKSTGREYFHLEWLQPFLPAQYNPTDVQTTLVELTVITLLDSIKKHFIRGEIFVCGGGVHNSFLMSRLKMLAKNFSVESTETFGVNPDWVEAMAFAWLAQQTLQKKSGNITTVTGAKQPVILGGVYYC